MAEDIKYYWELFAGETLIGKGELDDDKELTQKTAQAVAAGAADIHDDVSVFVVSAGVSDGWWIDEDGKMFEVGDELGGEVETDPFEETDE